MSIAVIAGLGNPGPKYRNSRHNVGFVLVDALARKFRCAWKLEARFEAEVATALLGERRILLVKPQTYMNASGRSLGAILRYHKFSPERLLAVYDDLHLTFGRVKLSVEGSAGGHNGVADLLERVGSGFARFRFGIGEKPHREMDLADYVLSRFDKAETDELERRMPDYLDQLQLVIDKGIEPAMNIINQRTAPQPQHERNNEP